MQRRTQFQTSHSQCIQQLREEVKTKPSAMKLLLPITCPPKTRRTSSNYRWARWTSSRRECWGSSEGTSTSSSTMCSKRGSTDGFLKAEEQASSTFSFNITTYQKRHSTPTKPCLSNSYSTLYLHSRRWESSPTQSLSKLWMSSFAINRTWKIREFYILILVSLPFGRMNGKDPLSPSVGALSCKKS